MSRQADSNAGREPWFAGRTAEETERRRFGLWALAALIVLLPPWWLYGADLAAAALRPVTALVMRLFGLPGVIDVGEDGAWLIATNLTYAESGRPYGTGLTREMVRRLLLGFPLLAAFLAAPPRPARPWRAALIAIGALSVVFVLSVVAVVWGQLAPALNHTLTANAAAMPTLAQPALHPMLAQTALVGRYWAMSAGGLAVAAVLWAVLNPRGRRALLAALESDRPG